MVKLRKQADRVKIKIVEAPIEVLESIWVVIDDIDKPIDYIDSVEFLEALSLLSLED